MDGATLSPRERRLLAALEAELRVDVELDLRLRTMRPHRCRHVLGPPCRALLTVLLALAALVAVTVAVVVVVAATAVIRPNIRSSPHDDRTGSGPPVG